MALEMSTLVIFEKNKRMIKYSLHMLNIVIIMGVGIYIFGYNYITLILLILIGASIIEYLFRMQREGGKIKVLTQIVGITLVLTILSLLYFVIGYIRDCIYHIGLSCSDWGALGYIVIFEYLGVAFLIIIPLYLYLKQKLKNTL